MLIALAVLLFVNAAFNAIVWPRFYRRVVADPRARDESGKPTRFLRVHAIIFAAALVISLTSFLVALFALIGVW